MTLQEAIKLLRQDIDSPGSVSIKKVNKAEELGIEALKRIEHYRSHAVGVEVNRLPWETEK